MKVELHWMDLGLKVELVVEPFIGITNQHYLVDRRNAEKPF